MQHEHTMFTTKKIYQYLRPETNKYEHVEEENWQWEAVYNNKTNLKQFDDAGHFHQIREIDQTKLIQFRMTSPYFPQKYLIEFKPGKYKLIHLYKKLRDWNTNELKGTIYLFGYESGQAKVVLAITPQNECIVCDDAELIKFGVE